MKFFYTGLFVLLSIIKVSAQTKATIDTAKTDNSSNISVITVGANCGNTANYYGQTTAEKLPYGSVDISYKSKIGLWTSVSALKLINTGSGISETDLSAGYDFDITKKLGGSLSYTRSFFPKSSPLPQSVNPNNVSANLSYNWKWLNTGAYGNYVFGNVRDESGSKVDDFFLTFNASKEIDLGSFSKKDYITVTPSIQLTGGTQRLGSVPESDEGVEDNNPSVLSFSGNKKQQIGPISDKPISRIEIPPNGRIGLIPGKRIPIEIPPPNGNGNKQGETSIIQSTSFDLVTTNFKLPVAYNRAHYTLEAAYQLSIPNKNFEGIVHENQSYFTLSFFYLFFKD